MRAISRGILKLQTRPRDSLWRSPDTFDNGAPIAARAIGDWWNAIAEGTPIQ
ncbi:MAG: hypothetical protein AAFY15_08150 [Cyanobacteria bacterium J06648_11]